MQQPEHLRREGCGTAAGAEIGEPDGKLVFLPATLPVFGDPAMSFLRAELDRLGISWYTRPSPRQLRG